MCCWTLGINSPISMERGSKWNLYYECGLQLACGFVVIRYFIITRTGGRCVCTVHREVSYTLFQYKELWHHKGQTQPSEIHRGSSRGWISNWLGFISVIRWFTNIVWDGPFILLIMLRWWETLTHGSVCLRKWTRSMRTHRLNWTRSFCLSKQRSGLG